MEYAKDIVERYPFDGRKDELSDKSAARTGYRQTKTARTRSPHIERVPFPAITSVDELEKVIRENTKRAKFLFVELSRISESGAVLGDVAGNVGVQQKMLTDLIRKHGTLVQFMSWLNSIK